MAVNNYSVDTEKSSISWTGKKITGSHTGTISISDGYLEIDNNTITGGNFFIDTRSIKITDIADAATNAQLSGHLLSDDFFAAQTFPTANFTINNVSATGNNNYRIDGLLTIKAITHSLSFDARIAFEENISATGQIIIDRTKYGMKFGSGNFFKGLGDALIYNDFILDLNLVTKEGLQ